MHAILLLCCVLPAQSSPAAEADARLDELRGQVRQMVRQLDANQREQRDAAEAALLEMGPDILGMLPSVTPRTPAEVKVRLQRIRKELETRMARSVGEASRVNLQGKLSLADALESLAEQSGNAVSGFENRGGQVEVDLRDVTYWQALDQVLDQVGLNIDPYGGMPNTLVLRARPENELPRADRATYAGPFRFEPIRLNARRDLRNASINALTITFSVTWEPRLKPISLRQPLDDVAVVDDRGEKLATSQNEYATLNVPIEAEISAVELVVPVELPQRGATKIASLSGRMTAVVPGAMKDFEYTELATSRDVEQANAGVVVIYEGMRKNQDLYDVRIRLRFDNAAGALQSHLGWANKNEAFIIDAKGKRQENLGLAQTARREDEVGFSYLFDLPDGPEGCKLVYRAPSLVMELPVEYELKDLPLP